MNRRRLKKILYNGILTAKYKNIDTVVDDMMKEILSSTIHWASEYLPITVGKYW